MSQVGYPTTRNYRGRAGTVRVPSPRRGGVGSQPRRTPGRPPARPRPSYRPPPSPGKLPTPPRVSSGAMRAASSALRGLGPLSAAFGVGYMLGSILFQPKDLGGLEISNPAGWATYICPDGGASCNSAGFYGPSGTTYAITTGSSTDNCICFQAISFTPSNSRRGYWAQSLSNPARYAHVISFVRGTRPFTPAPTATPIPARGAANPLVDPWFRDAVGPGIRVAPGLAPVIGNPVGPEVGPWPSAAPRPLPGVGGEGYASGEPKGEPRPEPRPGTRPNANPNPARPPRGTKERKMRASHVLGLANQTLGFITETEDLLDAFHKAIKKGCSPKAAPVWQAGGSDFSWKREKQGKRWGWVRAKGSYRAPSYMEKWNAVYKAFDKCIDMEAFWKAYIDNQAEDALFGTASKDDKEASKRLRKRLRFGIGLGPAL